MSVLVTCIGCGCRSRGECDNADDEETVDDSVSWPAIGAAAGRQPTRTEARTRPGGYWLVAQCSAMLCDSRGARRGEVRHRRGGEQRAGQQGWRGKPRMG